MGLLSWWKRKPVYSDVGVRLWTWLNQDGIWELGDQDTIRETQSGVRVSAVFGLYDGRIPRLRVSCDGYELPHGDLTYDDCARCYPKFYSLLCHLRNDNAMLEEHRSRREVRKAMGLK